MGTQPARTASRIAEHVANLGHVDNRIADRSERHLLRTYREKAVPALIEACSHENPKLRYRAAWVLGQIGDTAAFEVLLRLTEDRDPGGRYDAAIALGKLRDHRAIEPLVRLM